MRAAFDRPSAYDLSYLARESEVQPLHFVMQLEVAGRLTVEDVRGHVASRLPAAPVLLRHLRAPLGGGRPVWVDDPHFDMTRHVTAAGPDDVDPRQQLSAMVHEPLPRDRPLWRVVVGTSHERTYLALCVQHAMMDGGLLAVTLRALFDEEGVPRGELRPVPGPSALRLRLGAEKARAGRVLRQRSTPARPAVQRSPGPVSGERALAQAEVPLASLADFRERTGATVNDVYLAALTAGLRRWLVEPHDVVTVVPKDVRSPADPSIGNRHLALLVRLPVLTDDLLEVVRDVHAQVLAQKSATRTASGPERLAAELVTTNVRWAGRHVVAGRPVRAYHVGLPLQESRLAVCAMSYGGLLSLDFTADAQVHPDVDRLRDCTLDGLHELLALG